jgi:hypothetical protein
MHSEILGVTTSAINETLPFPQTKKSYFLSPETGEKGGFVASPVNGYSFRCLKIAGQSQSTIPQENFVLHQKLASFLL